MSKHTYEDTGLAYAGTFFFYFHDRFDTMEEKGCTVNTLKTTCFIFVLGALLSVVSMNTQASEWIPFGNTENPLFFDKKNVVSTPQKTIKVWTKKHIDAQEALEIMKWRVKEGHSTKGYEGPNGVDHALLRYELQCEAKEYRICGITEYNRNGKVLHTYLSTNEPWEQIAPDTIIDDLAKKVCIKKNTLSDSEHAKEGRSQKQRR